MNLIIILMIICLILILLQPKKNSFQNQKINFLALSYETNKDDKQVNNLIRMLQKNNFNYKIIGNGEKWESWYGRAIAYVNHLKTLDPSTYVLLCDGRDVLINEQYNFFIEKALKLRRENNNKIIIGTETGCCVGNNSLDYKAKNITTNDGENYHKIYMKQQEDNSKSKNINTPFYYINFGLIFATAGQLLNLFELLNISKNLDDQGLTHKLFYENPDILFLDHNQELFSNAGHREAMNSDRSKSNMEVCYFKWNGNKFYNTITNTTPSIIQTPGKNWDCYKYLANKLIDNPTFY